MQVQIEKTKKTMNKLMKRTSKNEEEIKCENFLAANLVIKSSILEGSFFSSIVPIKTERCRKIREVH
jgi:hypothetical protein